MFTGFVVHEKENVGPLSDHPKEFHHTRRSEGTPRTHLLTAEPLQGDLPARKKGVSKQRRGLKNRLWEKKEEERKEETRQNVLPLTFLRANLKPVLTS